MWFHTWPGTLGWERAEGLKVIDSNPADNSVEGNMSKMEFGFRSCPVCSPCLPMRLISLCQHGLGVFHLLHGRLRHHHQLLHQDRHRVQTQAQDLRAEHPGGAHARGFRIFARTLRALHFQIRGRLFGPDSQERQENAHPCQFPGPE